MKAEADAEVATLRRDVAAIKWELNSIGVQGTTSLCVMQTDMTRVPEEMASGGHVNPETVNEARSQMTKRSSDLTVFSSYMLY